MKASEVTSKAAKVIASCKTVKQVQTARMYIVHASVYISYWAGKDLMKLARDKSDEIFYGERR